jgi:hypothetical protein
MNPRRGSNLVPLALQPSVLPVGYGSSTILSSLERFLNNLTREYCYANSYT